MPAAEAYDTLQSVHEAAHTTPFDVNRHFYKAVGRYINLKEGMKITAAGQFIWSKHREIFNELYARAIATARQRQRRATSSSRSRSPSMHSCHEAHVDLGDARLDSQDDGASA